MSQRTDHVEIKLPPVFLKQIGAFHSLTAEDLPEVRIHVSGFNTSSYFKRNIWSKYMEFAFLVQLNSSETVEAAGRPTLRGWLAM